MTLSDISRKQMGAYHDKKKEQTSYNNLGLSWAKLVLNLSQGKLSLFEDMSYY